MTRDIAALFCCLDDFVRVYEGWQRHKRIDTGRLRQRQGLLSLSEMLLIMILFHASPFKTFKDFYLYGVQQKYRAYFKELPSYEPAFLIKTGASARRISENRFATSGFQLRKDRADADRV